ncbi:MAG: glycosyl transferase family 1 [Gammaproteobacteria bacterium]|nr:glycosyl transferase family 1 [Gammaproteobacteria bacterium]|tara:strand:- start:3856 stop:5007 length:1152 start_codon:yes stop_codon:yes gene_type:complete
MMTTMKRVLINASNLHTGGGVQVATSFINDLLGDRSRLADCIVSVYASDTVYENIDFQRINCDSLFTLKRFNVRGIESLKFGVSSEFQGFDLIFTIFGPFYTNQRVKHSIVGFAQAWIVYPNNEVYFRKSFLKRNFDRLKFRLQWSFFQKSDLLVVESEHLKERLSSYKGFSPSRVKVVPNCVAEIFRSEKKNRRDVEIFSRSPGVIYLGLISRDYIHKNLDFLMEVVIRLNQLGRLEYKIVVTLSDEEWSKKSPQFRSSLVNAGVVKYADLPNFYKQLDAVIFPSLLESFSVTPLEALATRKVLFASNREFVTDVCGGHAQYFDPLDTNSAAHAIIQWFEYTETSVRETVISAAYDHYMRLPTSSDRTQSYINLILEELTGI